MTTSWVTRSAALSEALQALCEAAQATAADPENSVALTQACVYFDLVASTLEQDLVASALGVPTPRQQVPLKLVRALAQCEERGQPSKRQRQE
jgi:hypothetical protein